MMWFMTHNEKQLLMSLFSLTIIQTNEVLCTEVIVVDFLVLYVLYKNLFCGLVEKSLF